MSSLISVQLHCISFAFLVAYISANQSSSNNHNNSSGDTTNKKRPAPNNSVNINNNIMSTEEEPPTKKAKAADDWDEHKMNMEECVMKADEIAFLSEIAQGDLRVLQGIGPMADKVLDAMGLKTIADLAGKLMNALSFVVVSL